MESKLNTKSDSNDLLVQVTNLISPNILTRSRVTEKEIYYVNVRFEVINLTTLIYEALPAIYPVYERRVECVICQFLTEKSSLLGWVNLIQNVSKMINIHQD